jgi:hypothetical protein
VGPCSWDFNFDGVEDGLHTKNRQIGASCEKPDQNGARKHHFCAEYVVTNGSFLKMTSFG